MTLILAAAVGILLVWVGVHEYRLRVYKRGMLKILTAIQTINNASLKLAQDVSAQENQVIENKQQAGSLTAYLNGMANDIGHLIVAVNELANEVSGDDILHGNTKPPTKQ